ncbi:hypothetical protein IAD21_00718 [Abditibacteriota bacterium]|nr:hypothetical protein IAD21_00718 [Abditibacteriota bacterium]
MRQLRDSQQGDWLTPEEREEAREFWEALVFSSSGSVLEASYQAFKQAPTLVQLAVIVAIERMKGQGVVLSSEANPFAANK